MSGYNIKVLGADQVIEKFEDLGDIDLTEPMTQITNEVRRSAVLYCPADTGRLRASIETSVTENGRVGAVGTNVHYAPYVEYGTGLFAAKKNGRKDVPWVYKDMEGHWHTTVGQKPQPFLHLALQHNKSKVRKTIEKFIGGQFND